MGRWCSSELAITLKQRCQACQLRLMSYSHDFFYRRTKTWKRLRKPLVDFASEKRKSESLLQTLQVEQELWTRCLLCRLQFSFIFCTSHVMLLHKTSLPRKSLFILLFLRQKWALWSKWSYNSIYRSIFFSEGTFLTLSYNGREVVTPFPTNFSPLQLVNFYGLFCILHF